MNPLLFIEPFKNFEKLCPDLVYQYKFYREESERDEKLHSLLPYKDIQQLQEHIATLKPFDGIVPFDMTRRKEIADNLNIFYRKILHQPFWYLEAVELYPDSLLLEDKLFERAKSVFYQIEHAQDKFNEMIVSVNRQLNDLVDSDKDSSIKLFNKILFNMDNLILSVGRNSFDHWYFDYKKSPLFIVLMEFIQLIKNRAGISTEYYPEVEAYLKNLSAYKNHFSYNTVSESQPDNLNGHPILYNSNSQIQTGLKNINQMDYLEIVLAGTEDSNTRHFLPEYFYREFKKAEQENYGEREFFNGCLSVIDSFEENIKLQFQQRKNELSSMKNSAENRTLKFKEDDNSKTHEQSCIDTIVYCDNELKNLKIVFYSLPLARISKGKHIGNLPYNHVLFIKNAIREARQKVLDSQKQETDTMKPIIESPGLEKLSIQDRALLNEKSKQFISQMQSYTKNYPSMSIEKWLNEVQPFENIKGFYVQLEKSLLTDIEFGNLSYKDTISILRLYKLSYSEPQNIHSTGIDNSQVHISFLQNIIEKLSALNDLIDDKKEESDGKIDIFLIDSILNDMLSLQPFELKTLKANLNGNKTYIGLNYRGTKTKLFKDLGRLRIAGIERNVIADVFSEYCTWQRTIASTPEKLKYNELYKKMK